MLKLSFPCCLKVVVLWFDTNPAKAEIGAVAKADQS